MGYARHIGRVGALAVALGVGVAMVTSPAVGLADGTNNTNATSTDAGGGGAAGAAGAPGAPGGAGAAGADGANGAEGPTDSGGEGGDVSGDISGGLSDEPSDEGLGDGPGAGLGDGLGEGLGEESGAGLGEGEQGGGDGALTGGDGEQDTPPSGLDTGGGGNDNNKPQGNDGAGVTGQVANQPTATGPDDTPADFGTPSGPDQQSAQMFGLGPNPDVGSTGTENARTVFATLTTDAPEAPPQRPTLIKVVTDLVAAVLNPLLSLGNDSPFQIPIVSAMLAVVRDELERVLKPRRANQANQQTIALVLNGEDQASMLEVDPTKQRVLVIGVDGTNLSRILADSEDNINFMALMNQSTTGAASIVGHTTISNPSWSAILTGFWSERTGVINNVFTPWTYDSYPTVFNQLEGANPDIRTMAIADWDVINAIAGAGANPVDQNIYVTQIEGDTNWLATDDLVGALTVDAIEGDLGPVPNFLFTYFVGVDENGHLYGGASPEYEEAITNVDENLGKIMAAIAEYEATHPGETWTVIVTTDHGHQPEKGFGHGFQSPDETETFVIARGTNFQSGYVNPEYEIVDTTPTVVTLFGLTPRAGSDGVPLMSLADSDELPDDLKQALLDEIATNQPPDALTNLALSLRTIFATVPYYIFTFKTDATSAVPDFLVLPVGLLFDGLYIVTNIPAQLVAILTGVSGATANLFHILPPAPPNIPPINGPADATLLSCTFGDGDLCESSVA